MYRARISLCGVLFLLVSASIAFGQAAPRPIYTGYKGVMIGVPMADARAKLGTPKSQSDSEDYFVISDNETVQVLYGADKTVRVLSINYIGKLAPNPMEILGTEIEAKPDGSMNKRISYPKAGFWIAYLKTGGDDPITVVTVQKLLPLQQ